jgi:hypothetical protein
MEIKANRKVGEILKSNKILNLVKHLELSKNNHNNKKKKSRL